MKILDSLPETLSEKEEAALAVKIKKGNEEAMNALALANMREGFVYAKGVCRSMIEDGEVFSQTFSALKAAAKRFNPKHGRFFGFAKPRIRGALTRFWNTLDTVKHASLHESDGQIARVDSHIEYLRDPEGDGPEWDSYSVFEPHEMPRTDEIEFNDDLASILPIIRDRLDPQEQMVLDLVFIASFTFEEVGELLDISRSAVQLTRTRALKKIRAALSEKTRLLR